MRLELLVQQDGSYADPDKLVRVIECSDYAIWDAVTLETSMGSYDLIEINPNVYAGMCHNTRVEVSLNGNTGTLTY